MIAINKIYYTIIKNLIKHTKTIAMKSNETKGKDNQNVKTIFAFKF